MKKFQNIINNIKARTSIWDRTIVIEIAIAVIVIVAVIIVCVSFYDGESATHSTTTDYVNTWINCRTITNNVNNIIH